MSRDDLPICHVSPSVNWRGFLVPVLMVMLAALLGYAGPMVAALLGCPAACRGD